MQDPKDTPPPTRAETRDERRERKRREKAEQVAYKLEQEIAMCESHDTLGHLNFFSLLSHPFANCQCLERNLIELYLLRFHAISGDPHSSSASTMDPFKTLFIARIVSSVFQRFS